MGFMYRELFYVDISQLAGVQFEKSVLVFSFYNDKTAAECDLLHWDTGTERER